MSKTYGNGPFGDREEDVKRSPDYLIIFPKRKAITSLLEIQFILQIWSVSDFPTSSLPKSHRDFLPGSRKRDRINPGWHITRRNRKLTARGAGQQALTLHCGSSLWESEFSSRPSHHWADSEEGCIGFIEKFYFGNCSALGCQMKRLLIVIWIPIETGPFVSDCGPGTVLNKGSFLLYKNASAWGKPVIDKWWQSASALKCFRFC